MTKTGLLIAGAAGMFAMPGCLEEWPAEDVDEAEVAEAELAVTPEPDTPNVLAGLFHPIQLVNTNWCVQPQGGSTENVEVELSACDGSDAQQWQVDEVSGGVRLINQHSGKCLWSSAPLPLFNGGRPIVQRPCNITGTSTTASNALWKPARLAGEGQLMSRVQRRDTGFCLDVPFELPGQGVTMQMFRCNGTGAQFWRIGVD